VASVVIFSIEYLFRFYLAPEDEEFKKHRFARAKYATSPFAIIDLIAILPFFLQAFVPVDLRALRFLRLLRILKIFPIITRQLKNVRINTIYCKKEFAI
jgi:voltage-gated potassium channel